MMGNSSANSVGFDTDCRFTLSSLTDDLPDLRGKFIYYLPGFSRIIFMINKTSLMTGLISLHCRSIYDIALSFELRPESWVIRFGCFNF